MTGVLICLVSAAALLTVEPAWAGKPKITKTKAKLPPMEKPAAWQAGHKLLVTRDGKDAWLTLASVDGGVRRFERSDGCQFTRDQDMFTPSLNWNNCGAGGSGSQKYTLKGDIWPLTAGKKWKYKRSGRNDAGISWDHATTCKVHKKVYRVRTDSGQWDTYKVTCSDRPTDRTWYVSPEVGTWVYYRYDHIRRGRTDTVLTEVVTK